MKKASYREGDVFTVPLRNGKFSIGVLARSSKSGWSLLGYFFPHQFETIPQQNELPTLTPDTPIRKASKTKHTKPRGMKAISLTLAVCFAITTDSLAGLQVGPTYHCSRDRDNPTFGS
jgi:hypothetical protein